MVEHTHTSVTANPATSAKGKEPSDRGILLMSYPKVVFLWPAWLVAWIAGITLYFAPNAAGTQLVLTWTFLIVLAVNMVVLAFDFPRATSLLLFAVIVALGLGASLLVVYNPDLLPRVRQMFVAMHPLANSTFFFLFAGFMTVIYAVVLITVRLDYWEVRPNELLHHHGVLSDLERFSSPNLRIDKEINDIFEFLLMGSGRLILHPSNERRAIVLDNVFFINKKEKAITQLLGALQVQVRDKTS